MKNKKWLLLIGIAFIVLIGVTGLVIRESFAAGVNYKILAWNDLGMHCYSRDFADMAVLPPYNNLWVQVVQVGDPPKVVTSGIKVEYFYQDNTYSVGKTNFWSYDQALFGVNLPSNVGLKGKGLAGTMDLSGDHFIAEGIPITEFSDSAPTVRQPYQLVTVVVKDSTTGDMLTSTQVVTPTSSEMRCDVCHSDTGIAKPEFPTGKVETNILKLHDEASGTNLMASRPVLCASCHASNALGMPGNPNLPNLSKAMHEQHSGIIPSTLDGCYNCHPGPQTRCLRDVMSTQLGMTCVSCHGSMATVASNPNPWLNEPRCDACHNSGSYNQDQALYRFSKEHGGLYCEACHDSTHAIAPSREGNDAIKFNQLQGKNGPIDECSVCHTLVPVGGGPHALPSTVTISGNTGVGGVMLNYVDATSKTVMSDGSGYYFITVSSGWSGTITPHKSGYVFIPASQSYSNVQSNQSTQDYTATPTSTFNDVPTSYWAWQSIERLYNAGITGGCTTSSLNYCPENQVTRAQMAVFLLKGMHGSAYTPPSVGGSTGFGDVSTSYWAAAWIKQLAAEGVTGGCGNGNFCPDAPVTRAQMAVFLLKSKHGVAYTPSPATGVFSDVSIGYWADKWIEQLAAEGITSGCTTIPLNYCPDNAVTRAQMAVFLVKTFNLP